MTPKADDTHDRLTSRLDDYRRRPARTAVAGWQRYAAATGAVVAGASTAEAAVVFVTPPSPVRFTIDPAATSTGSAGGIDVDGDGVDDLTLGLFRAVGTDSSFLVTGSVTYRTDYDRGVVLGGGVGAYYGTGAPGVWLTSDTYSVKRLASDDPVSSGGRFNPIGGFRGVSNYTVTTDGGYSNVGASSYGEFPANGTALAGFAFPRGGDTHFGWVRVAIESDPTSGYPTAVEALEWAYEDVAGEAIAAGAIPEPTGLGLLTLGAAGIAGLRRRSEVA